MFVWERFNSSIFNFQSKHFSNIRSRVTKNLNLRFMDFFEHPKGCFKKQWIYTSSWSWLVITHHFHWFRFLLFSSFRPGPRAPPLARSNSGGLLVRPHDPRRRRPRPRPCAPRRPWPWQPLLTAKGHLAPVAWVQARWQGRASGVGAGTMDEEGPMA